MREAVELHLDGYAACRELVAQVLSDPAPARPALADGPRIGRYRVLREVGSGSMGRSTLPRIPSWAARSRSRSCARQGVTADWIIDLGPEGGAAGGEIIAAGTPEQVAQIERSYTGQFVRPLLERASKQRASGARGSNGSVELRARPAERAARSRAASAAP